MKAPNPLGPPPSDLSSRLFGHWYMGVKGRHFEEMQNSFSGTEFSIHSSTIYRLNPSLSFILNGKLAFKNDHVQLEYRDEYSKGNFKIYEAIVQAQPFSFLPELSFQAGAIDQSPYSSPIFVYERSLPGLSEKFDYERGSLRLTLRAQQSLATAKSFSADRSEAEDTPIFNMETLEARWKSIDKIWQVKANLSHFMFDHLAAVTAADGSKIGHFTLGSGSTARFRYGFAGLLAQGELGYWAVNGFRVVGGGFWLNNQTAKFDGQGQSLYLKMSLPVSTYNLSFSYMNFFKEREAAPAVFSNLSLGGNNRVGNKVGLSVELQDLGVTVLGEFIQVDTIKQSEGGRRGLSRSYYFGLETLNVRF